MWSLGLYKGVEKKAIRKVYKLNIRAVFAELSCRVLYKVIKLLQRCKYVYSAIVQVHTPDTVHMCDNMSAGSKNGKVLSDGGFNTFKLVKGILSTFG